MRITAIRGRGLASLFDPFEVLLDEGPLAQSGLYCISGQTGAGKSTILDAMCLALFGETPRLTGRGKSKIGRIETGQDDLRLSDRDPRALLSRGCGEGYAEVEFIGVDQEKYRARWSVRRSRKSSTGRLQKATVELLRVADNKVLSDHPTTKTLAEISNKLGLSFDQFCRSVLLAQGDFSAFLRADDKERADLLERMTGTEIYRKLSKACHQRNKDEQALAQSAKDAVANLQIWDEATLAEKKAQKQQAEHKVHKAQAEVTKARAQQAAFERRVSLEQRLEQAKQAQSVAKQAWEQAGPERQDLAQLMAVHQLRPLHEQLGALQAKANGLQASLGTTQKQLEQARDESSKAKLGVEKSLAKLKERQLAHQEKAPQLQAAQAIDLQLVQFHEAQVEHQQKVQERELVLGKLRVLRDEITDKRTALDAQIASIDAAWPEYERSLALYGRREELCEVFAQLLELQKEHVAKASAIQAQRQEKAELEKQQATLQVQLKELRHALAQEPAPSPEQEAQTSQRLKDLGRASAQCQRALTLVKEAQTASEYGEQLEQRKLGGSAKNQELETKLAENRRATQLGQKKCEELDIRLDEARRLRDEAHAQEVMRGHRDLLREGSPCPLCGSTEHPLMQQEGSVSTDAFALATKRLQALEQAQKVEQKGLLELEKTRVALRTRIESSKRELQEVLTQLDASTLRTQALHNDGQAALDELNFAFDQRLAQDLEEIKRSPLQARGPALARLSAKLDEAHNELSRALDQAAKRRAKQRELLGQQEALIEGERTLAPKLAQVGALLATSSSEDQALVERSKTLRARLSGLWKGTPGPWSSRVDSLPELHEQVLAWLGALEKAIAMRKRCQEQREHQQTELERTTQQLTLEQKRLQDRKTLRDEVAAKKQEAQVQRSSLLQGVATDVFLKSYERDCVQLESASQVAKERYEVQTTTLTRELARCESLQEQIGSLAAEQLRTQNRFDLELAQLGVPAKAAQEALQIPKASVQAMQTKQQTLEQALRSAQTLVQSRSEDLKLDQKDNEILAPGPEIQQALTCAIEQLEPAQRALVEIEHAFEQNAAKARERQSLSQAHEAQLEKAKRWAQLSALIGHSEGLSFQRFAQGLSLDRLLLLANRHLQDIDRRYRLSRVHGDSLDLQVVDTMMGDEIRSIHSLSGGESFLISLALALGLSSLSAMHTKVESLFIDEGFGTLDRESLEQVLAALDALQATGRQVGLISHVEGMAEQLGARVQVRPLGHGKSRILVQGGKR